jgi:phosphotransferase system HPr (HPr) family protein
MLAAAKGTEVELQAEGADETQALQAIEKLFLDGFGEL